MACIVGVSALSRARLGLVAARTGVDVRAAVRDLFVTPDEVAAAGGSTVAGALAPLRRFPRVSMALNYYYYYY